MDKNSKNVLKIHKIIIIYLCNYNSNDDYLNIQFYVFNINLVL